MAVYWFNKIAREGRLAGITPQAGREAIEWYRTRASKVRSININRMMQEDERVMLTRLDGRHVGQMFSFFYDPKWKDTLPWWDQFPLIFPIEHQGDRLLSLQLHYISPILRARLMDALYTIAVRNENDEIQRIGLSYGILTSATRFRYFRPCVKTHLLSHVRSRFMRIPVKDWDKALLLPTQRFIGASPGEVWADSERQLLRRRRPRRR